MTETSGEFKDMPLVSLVIPTRHRPKLVLRAIHSVLNQTHREIELIVVVDGPDAATVTAVQSVEDPRLQLVINPRSLTAAGARNIGAEPFYGRSGYDQSAAGRPRIVV
jgi:glycosyltransferase involved in cell wall biosynthesis